MKKALLIGKFNEITKEISAYLSETCRVQLCIDDKETLKGMLEMIKPDLVTVLLTGITMNPQEILSILFTRYSNIRIIVIGNSDDQKILSQNGYLAYEWIRFLQRPVNLEKVSTCVNELLYSGGTEKKSLKDISNENKETILLVDDSPSLLRAMQSMLSQKYKVNFVTSGTQAIAAIAKDRPDIILLDYEMPICDGRMTLQMLRSEESTKDIPVVFLTGIADSAHVIEVMELRPQGYLLKPCSEKKIFSTIENVLKESKNKKDDGKN